MEEKMIKVQNICKTYKVAKRNKGLKEAAKALFKRDYEYIKALNDVSFTISEGETVGYIGPNGAGKSSTIKVLCGILTPDSGTCEIAGLVPWKKRVEYVKNIGVVFGQRTQLWWDIPVIDSFELLKDIYSVPQNLFQNNLEELINLLELKEIYPVISLAGAITIENREEDFPFAVEIKSCAPGFLASIFNELMHEVKDILIYTYYCKVNL